MALHRLRLLQNPGPLGQAAEAILGALPLAVAIGRRGSQPLPSSPRGAAAHPQGSCDPADRAVAGATEKEIQVPLLRGEENKL